MSDLMDGALARQGLLSKDACATAQDVLDRVKRDGLETVRILFADQHGVLRGKTVVASALRSAFTSGIAAPSTLLLKDTSHRTVFPVWSDESGIDAGPMQGANDVLLVPDPDSFRVLPWSPHSAWLLCTPVFRDGTQIPFASRSVLEGAVAALDAQGLAAVIGLEVEFHVFERLDPSLDHAQTTMPGAPSTTRALTQGYQFLTETRYGEVEPILDTLRRHAQKLGLPVRSVEIEMGPSQFEFTFDPGDPMTQADNLVMFRTLVKEVCAAQGLHASFMAKPNLENIAANGWHIHQSLIDRKTGRNLFMPDEAGLTPQAAGWIAGLLTHARASSLLTVPTVNGYKRYQPFQLAPDRVQWGEDNRGAMVRALLMPGDPASRVENRAPESAANPHYALAAQLISGLDGLNRTLAPPPPTVSPYDSAAERLPQTMADAIDAFDASPLYRATLGDATVDYLLRIKRAEWARYLSTVSEWEQAEYFGLF
ncbi:glutamine synthetase family protein [Phaeobacter marinintestinus]|uniref:glutamine synthetase family protein n=1 Tax=Falsiphaeobacter marinintestinus TaxID=1492905 RepID=UPI0011B625A8|nr:glutamine synthetase family protein [Phaeobacter marinintestinus]